MSDFATFRTFITPGILVVCYYVGAVLMPLAALVFWLWLRRRYPVLQELFATGIDAANSVLTRRQKIGIGAAMAVCFFFAEIAWRMMFETMIAYFQMREALVTLAS